MDFADGTGPSLATAPFNLPGEQEHDSIRLFGTGEGAEDNAHVENTVDAEQLVIYVENSIDGEFIKIRKQAQKHAQGKLQQLADAPITGREALVRVVDGFSASLDTVIIFVQVGDPGNLCSFFQECLDVLTRAGASRWSGTDEYVPIRSSPEPRKHRKLLSFCECVSKALLSLHIY